MYDIQYLLKTNFIPDIIVSCSTVAGSPNLGPSSSPVCGSQTGKVNGNKRPTNKKPSLQGRAMAI